MYIYAINITFTPANMYDMLFLYLNLLLANKEVHQVANEVWTRESFWEGNWRQGDTITMPIYMSACYISIYILWFLTDQATRGSVVLLFSLIHVFEFIHVFICQFGIEDLKRSPDQTTCWDGVRNYQVYIYIYIIYIYILHIY